MTLNGDDSSDNSKPKSAPVFGDVLHINGQPQVFINIDHDGDWVFRSKTDATSYHKSLSDFDEYKPNKAQELRNRILERWQRKRLENAWDTEVCRTELSVGDLVDFVVENIKDEFGE